MLTVITSRQNGRVKALRAALAGRGDVAIEGEHLIREAVRSGVPIGTLYLREDRSAFAATLPAVETLLLTQEVFASAAATEHAQGIAALLRPQPLPYAAQRGDLLLVAAGLQDPGNLGTLIRSAEAFGAAAVVLTEGTVDPWNGKALRASAGSTFRIPLLRWSLPLRQSLRDAGIRTVAAVPRDGTVAHLTDLRGGCALLIGNEGQGVPPSLLTAADARIRISTPGPTESLNAAVAGSLLLYEAARQRGT